MSLVFFLVGSAYGQLAPNSLRLWASNSLADGIQDGLRPVIADILCSIPMKRVLDGASVQEGPVEIVINDFVMSDCTVHDFTVHNELGGILVKITGLNAAAWGAAVAKQAGCTSFMCPSPMDTTFTADIHNSNIAMLLQLAALNGKPAVRVGSISSDLHLRNIQLHNFQGLSPFANLVSSVMEKAINRLAERKVSSTVDKVSAVFDRLPFHGLPIGRLLGGAVPRAVNLQFDADVNSIHYVSPAWVVDVLTVLSSPPEVGRRAYPHAPTLLPSVPPIDHRFQQLIGTASPWAVNEMLFVLEQLGFFRKQLEVDAHGMRVPASLSVSPSLAIRSERAEITLKSTFTGPTEYANSTITLGADSPRLTLVGNLLKAKVAGVAYARADVKGCGARTASIRHSPLPGSASSAANRPEIAIDLRSEREAPWWEVECDSPGANLLMSALGLDSIEATASCIGQGLKKATSSSETLQCLITVWASKMDLIYELLMCVNAARPEGMPDLLSFLWDQLIAIGEEIIERSPGGELRSADIAALHACLETRTPAAKVSETYHCLAAAAGPAIDATYPSILDLRSMILTPELAALADELVAGTTPSTVLAVVARVNAIVSLNAQPIQQVLDDIMRVFSDLLIAMSESAGSERIEAVTAALRPLVPVLWSALQHVHISVDGAPIGQEYDLSDWDTLVDRVLSALIAGKAFKWTLAAKGGADLVGTYTRSGVGYVLHPPAALMVDIELDPIFTAADSIVAGLSPSARPSAVPEESSAGSLRVGYRSEAGGFDYMAEANWKAIVLKLLDSMGMGLLASAVRALPGWVDNFVGEWTNGHFWGSLDLGIDGRKVLAGIPLAMDEIFDARYTSELARILREA